MKVYLINLINTTVALKWMLKVNSVKKIIYVIAFILSIFLLLIYLYSGHLYLSLLIGIVLFASSFSAVKSKDHQLLLIFLTWTVSKFLICLLFLIFLGSRLYKYNDIVDLYPFLLSLIWIPSLEFFKFNMKAPYLLFTIRWLLSIVVILAWIAHVN